MQIQLTRRAALCVGLATALAACAAPAASAHQMHVRRDAGCGCCHVWTEQLAAGGRFAPRLTDEMDMPALKQRLGVPGELASCHTATVGGYVIEGHVPGADILKLLEERPADIAGLAVPGMPLGSPGMEQPDGASEPFDVIAFGRNGERRVFARHGA
jgi:hypothetical protein